MYTRKLTWLFLSSKSRLLFLFLLSVHILQAQISIPIGTWRTHFSYQQINHVVTAGDRIYCAARNGLFYLDKSDNSLNILSKADGLSDAGVTAMAYESPSDALLIAYSSGVVDLLTGNRITSFSLIRDANQNEQINHILFTGSTAYLSTDRGVRILEIQAGKKPDIQIIESYTNLSKTGDQLPIFSSTIVQDSLFLATEEGILAASLSPHTNRQDFRNWRRFGEEQGIPSQSVHFITSIEDQVYAGVDKTGLYRYHNNQWQLTEVRTDKNFESLRATSDKLVLALGDAVILYQNQTSTTIESSLITQPHDAVIDIQGTLWIGDHENGLVKKHDSSFANFFPEGPESDQIGKLKYLNKRILALKEKSSTEGAFYVFKEGDWINYSSGGGLPARAATPLLDVAFDATSETYFFASFGAGVLQWNGEEDFILIDAGSDGSTLQNNQVTSLAIRKQTIWIANFSTSASLHALELTESRWKNFSFSTQPPSYPLKMILAEDENLWLLLNDRPLPANSGDDLMVFHPEDEKYLFLKDEIASAEWPGEKITDITQDQDGQIWIGGNAGVAFFPNPWDIFSEASLVKPIFDKQFLLLGEYVTAIAVDGGNRKWIGTRNGLWLFDEAGQTLISHFTTENSPLISNVIIDISINDADGEVFIATDRGLVSYRGTATRGGQEHQSVKIFPNPVLSDFSGHVGIQGLVSGATVKITSISGTLVRQLKAEGGMAVWDIRDYRGGRVGTGVYLIFSASADGEETFIGKIAIID